MIDTRKVRVELIKRLQKSQVAMVLATVAQQRIRSRGADIGGYPSLWADTARIEITKKQRGKTVKKSIPHYRAGGKPLYDTGNLFRSLHGVTQAVGNGVGMVLRGSMVALMQHKGFKTSGPNWIPFSRGAMRAAATKEKTREGKSNKTGTFPTSSPDGLYVGKGVMVPARPLFAWPKTAKRTLVRSVARVMGAR